MYQVSQNRSYKLPKVLAIRLGSHFPAHLFILPFSVLGAVLLLESLCLPTGPAQTSPPRPIIWEVILGDGDVGSGQLACSLESLLCTEGQNHSIKHTREFRYCPGLLGFVFLCSFSLLWF